MHELLVFFQCQRGPSLNKKWFYNFTKILWSTLEELSTYHFKMLTIYPLFFIQMVSWNAQKRPSTGHTAEDWFNMIQFLPQVSHKKKCWNFLFLLLFITVALNVLQRLPQSCSVKGLVIIEIDKFCFCLFFFLSTFKTCVLNDYFHPLKMNNKFCCSSFKRCQVTLFRLIKKVLDTQG